MRSPGWALMSCGRGPRKERRRDTDTQREDHVRTQGQTAILRPRTEACGETKPDDTLTLDFSRQD